MGPVNGRKRQGTELGSYVSAIARIANAIDPAAMTVDVKWCPARVVKFRRLMARELSGAGQGRAQAAQQTVGG
jgi:hypothetical protein